MLFGAQSQDPRQARPRKGARKRPSPRRYAQHETKGSGCMRVQSLVGRNEVGGTSTERTGNLQNARRSTVSRHSGPQRGSEVRLQQGEGPRSAQGQVQKDLQRRAHPTARSRLWTLGGVVCSGTSASGPESRKPPRAQLPEQPTATLGE